MREPKNEDCENFPEKPFLINSSHEWLSDRSNDVTRSFLQTGYPLNFDHAFNSRIWLNEYTVTGQ